MAGHRQCGVCGWRVERGSSCSSVVTSCCGNKHHRDCIQVLASLGLSSCPSCGSGEEYKSEMVVNGIYFSSVQPGLQDESASPSPVQEDSFRDSGISLSSPLTSSTPINVQSEMDNTQKRKSINDLCSSVKRSKSHHGESGLDDVLSNSLIELKPRKIEESELEMETDQEDGSVVVNDSDKSDYEHSSRPEIDFQIPEKEIEMSSSSSGKNELAIISTSLEDLEDSDSYLDDSLGELYASSDETEYDSEDLKALNDETDFELEDLRAVKDETDFDLEDPQALNDETDFELEDPQALNKEEKETASSGNTESNCEIEEVKDLPALTYEPRRGKKISKKQRKRKQKEILKQIRKRPLKDRSVLHGHHPAFHIWNPEVGFEFGELTRLIILMSGRRLHRS